MAVKQNNKGNVSFLENEIVHKSDQGAKYCRFRKYGIKYIDYKEVNFLMRFLNDQGKILPRRITGNSLKYQKKVAQAVKRARQVALLPYLGDNLKVQKQA